MEINYIFEKLFNYFNVSTIRELSEKINISESTISKWKQRNSINAIKKKCRELGIYNEIFGDLNPININQNIDNKGNNTGLNFGSMNINQDKDLFDEEILTILRSIYPIIENNQIKKDSFVKNLKFWLVENI